MKRTLKICAVVVAMLVVCGVVAALVVDVDGMINEQIAKQKPEIEAKLGRKVEVGKVSARLLPSIRGEVESVRIEADPNRKEQDRPLLELGSVRFEVSLWDAVTSLGKRITLSEVVVSKLKVNVVRHADGTVSYQDILDRQPKEAPKEEPAGPMSPETQELLRNFAIGEARIEDAELRLVDLATPTGKPAESFIKKLNLRLENVRLTKPVSLHLDAALFSDATNFELDVSAGPFPADLDFKGPPPLNSLKVKLTSVDLSRLSPYLPSKGIARIDSAVASADWQVGAISKDQPLPVKGTFELKQVQLGGGEKFDVSLAADLSADLSKLGVQIARLDLKVGSIELAMKGALEDLAAAPKFKDFTVSSKSLSPGALLAYYPAAKADLPEGLKLSGAAHLDVKATGDAARQKLSAVLDLAPLGIHYPGKLNKPKGMPMALSVAGDFSANEARLENLGVLLDDLDLRIRGTVKNFADPAFDLTAAAKPFSFDRLVRLAPAIGEELAKQKAKASGVGQLDGYLKGTQTNLDGKLELTLAGMKLDVPGTKVDGDMKMTARAVGNPKANLKADVQFDASQALIQVKEVMNKGVKTPLKLAMSLERTPERLDVRKFDLQLAELGLKVTGGIDYPKNAVDVRVDLERLDLEKLAKTITAIPAARVKNSFVGFRMAISGDPDRMETIELALTELSARIGRSDLAGSMRVKNPKKPEVTMTTRSTLLDLDELFPDDGKSKEKKEKKPTAAASAGDDPELKGYKFTGDFEAKTVVYEGSQLTGFQCRVKLAEGVLDLEECTFGAYGGSVSAKGTQAEIWRGKMPFKAQVVAKDIEIGQALSEQTRYGAVLQGKTNLDLRLSGQGYDTPSLEKFLVGSIDLGMKQGRFAKASLAESVVGQLGQLNQAAGSKAAALTNNNQIRDLAAKLEVKDGKMRLTQPVTFDLDGGKATLEGAVGIAGKLFLKGIYLLPGANLGKLTQGRCSSNEPLPIPVEIAGSLDGPEYKPEVTGIARSLFDSCLKSQAATAVKDAVKAKLGVEVPTTTDDAKKRLEAETAKQKAELEAKARAEADRRAAELRKKAEDEAKKKAAGMLKGFGF
ncbi:MAG: AsmA family protein [Myxococcaceae bacterium]